MSIGVLVAVGAVSYEAGILAVERDPQITIVRRCVDVTDVLATAATLHVDVAVVSINLRGIDADVVERLRDSSVAVVGVARDAEERASLLRIGADAVLDSGDLNDLIALLKSAPTDAGRQDRAADGGPGPRTGGRAVATDPARSGSTGKVIAVWGPTGAPGRSTIAMGLAAGLAAGPATARPTRSAAPRPSVLLIDADVYGGSQAAMLGILDEASGLLAVARAANGGSLTTDELSTHVREVSPGLAVLTGLPRADRWTELRSVLVRNIIKVARQYAGSIVIDCGFSVEFDEEISYDTQAPRRNGATVAILDQADEILVVGQADPVGLSRLIRSVAELAELQPTARTRIVVNRMRPALGWSRDDVLALIASTTGSSAVSWLPDDPQACDQALVHGKTLHERSGDSRLVKALNALAAELSDSSVVAKPIRERWRPRRRTT